MSKFADDSNTFRTLKGFPPPPGAKSASPEKALPGLEVDLYALAEEIYALLEQELVLENERLVRRQSW